MDVSTILSAAVTERRQKFFPKVFGEGLKGYLVIARKNPESQRFVEQFYEYPNQLDQVYHQIEETLSSTDLYYCPQLFSEKIRKKEYCLHVSCLWSDLDECAPEKLLVRPTILTQTSPGRHQALWLLDRLMDPFQAEELSKRIAYYHRHDGADISGWDITQLLRIPFTFNFKYPDPTPSVDIIETNNALYRPEDFDKYPLVSGQISLNGSKLPEPLPTGAEELLRKYNHRLPDLVWRNFHTEPWDADKFDPNRGWYRQLWQLETTLFEAGLSPEEVFTISLEAKCNKYARDGRPRTDLWTDVLKAQAHVVNQSEAQKFRLQKLTDLRVEKPKPGFVEQYIDWASKQTDAASVYHQASAFAILSASLSGMITLPTSSQPRGMKLNMWFMVLGDTTLTRKSTAMNLGMDLLADASSNAATITDATIEGLLTQMAGRAGQPSIFLRDEFSGMLDAMQRKDYHAGMAEQLTQLYDGRNIVRQLARSQVVVTEPIFIMFTGGIRSRILELMHEDYIRSGFLPRFLFFSAVSDIGKMRPLGPPTSNANSGRADLLLALQQLIAKYDKLDTIQIMNTTTSVRREWKAVLDSDAWARSADLETSLVDDGLNSRDPDLFTPVYQRLGTSILKAATLIAASRSDNPVDNKTVRVTLDDLEHAIYYGEQWRSCALEIISSAGTTATESKLRRMFEYIESRSQHGASRQTMLRTFKLTAKDGHGLFETLEARGQVKYITQGSDRIYFPTEG